jgi:PhnB protein
VDDVDAQYQQAVAAGMTEVSTPMDMFCCEHMSVLSDPYGHT